METDHGEGLTRLMEVNVSPLKSWDSIMTGNQFVAFRC